MKKGLLFSLLTLTLLSPASAQVKALKGNPYMGKNVTRTYYLADLEGCAGLLDMQAGDLWTITFPENITSFFMTRSGIVEAKTQDNRLLLAGVSSSGSVPIVVLTESAQAPKFVVTMQAGKGGQVKDVQILSGLPPKRTCPESTATQRNTAPSAVAAITPEASASSVIASIPPRQTAPTTPIAAGPVAAEEDPVTVQSPVLSARPAPAPASASNFNKLVSPAPSVSTRFSAPTTQTNGVAGAYLKDRRGITVKMKIIDPLQIRVEVSNTLDSAVTFSTKNLNCAGAKTTEDITFNVAPQKTVNRLIPLNTNAYLKRGNVSWQGKVQRTGEILIVRGTTAN